MSSGVKIDKSAMKQQGDMCQEGELRGLAESPNSALRVRKGPKWGCLS
jgi:hypothetical protein